MNNNITILSNKILDFKAFVRFMEMDNCIELIYEDVSHETPEWYFYRPSYSTTFFSISYTCSTYLISMDSFASIEDYKFFPYLIDSLTQFLQGKIEHFDAESDNIYQLLDERWMETSIGDEIAQLKGSLTVFPKYYIQSSLVGDAYVSIEKLNEFGVGLHSSTPRIYGYTQFMMKNNLIPISTPEEITKEKNSEENHQEYEVDIPQHHSIGKVKSWQLDGEETYESYSSEDVELLLLIGEMFLKGDQTKGVVLNDLGTIYQEGIGVDKNENEAIKWFEYAFQQGDTFFAPTNLGDLYRKGSDSIPKSLEKAFYWYSKSTDPYSLYRLGQAYEEGWIGNPDSEKAMQWFDKALKAGHHLALKRVQQNN